MPKKRQNDDNTQGGAAPRRLKFDQEHLNDRLRNACIQGDLNGAQALLDQGAYLEARGWEQATPLHYALGGKHEEVAQELLNRGAYVNAKTMGGYTPLHLAASNGCTDTARMLIEKRADLHATAGQNKKTPLDLAMDFRNLNIAALLLKKQPKEFEPTLRDAVENGEPEIVSDLLKRLGAPSPADLEAGPEGKALKQWTDEELHKGWTDRELKQAPDTQLSSFTMVNLAKHNRIIIDCPYDKDVSLPFKNWADKVTKEAPAEQGAIDPSPIKERVRNPFAPHIQKATLKGEKLEAFYKAPQPTTQRS